jgi:hypothetical protein
VLLRLFRFLLRPPPFHLNGVVPKFVFFPLCCDALLVCQHAAIDITGMGRIETLGELGHFPWANGAIQLPKDELDALDV